MAISFSTFIEFNTGITGVSVNTYINRGYKIWPGYVLGYTRAHFIGYTNGRKQILDFYLTLAGMQITKH